MCHYCKNNTHNADQCRKKNNSLKAAVNENSEQNSFIFRISLDNEELFYETHDIKTVLVDCGATTHVVKDKSCFINMDPDFDPEKHTIELAD